MNLCIRIIKTEIKKAVVTGFRREAACKKSNKEMSYENGRRKEIHYGKDDYYSSTDRRDHASRL